LDLTHASLTHQRKIAVCTAHLHILPDFQI
jgi:hypothetical protein